MATEVNTQFTSTSANRLVWVLNQDASPYTEVFRGKEITIPSSNEKIARLSGEGGNLMHYLEARRFLGQPKAAAVKNTRGDYMIRPKALRTVELTEEERQAIQGVTSQEIQNQEQKDAQYNSKVSAQTILGDNKRAEPVAE